MNLHPQRPDNNGLRQRAWSLVLAAGAGESRYQREPADRRTPEDVFERRWAMVLLKQSLSRLRREYTEAGNQENSRAFGWRL